MGAHLAMLLALSAAAPPAFTQSPSPAAKRIDAAQVKITKSPDAAEGYNALARRARETAEYLFTADAGVGAGQKRPPRLSYSACSGPGGSRFANWANGLNGLRASWVD